MSARRTFHSILKGGRKGGWSATQTYSVVSAVGMSIWSQMLYKRKLKWAPGCCYWSGAGDREVKGEGDVRRVFMLTYFCLLPIMALPSTSCLCPLYLLFLTVLKFVSLLTYFPTVVGTLKQWQIFTCFFDLFNRWTSILWKLLQVSPRRVPFQRKHKKLITSPPSSWRSAPMGRTGWSTGMARITR